MDLQRHDEELVVVMLEQALGYLVIAADMREFAIVILDPVKGLRDQRALLLVEQLALARSSKSAPRTVKY